MMQTHLIRYAVQAHAILGAFFINGRFACFTMENDKYEISVGRYALRYAEPIPPRLSSAYGHNLIEVTIPGTTHLGGRDQILFHKGLIPDHSRGCILVSDGVESHVDANDNARLFVSGRAYSRIYAVITHALNQPEDVAFEVSWITPMIKSIDMDKVVTIS